MKSFKEFLNEQALTEKKYGANLTDEEYQKIRQASMRGRFNHGFSRNDNGDVTFNTKNPKSLAKDLENLIDPGESTWSEILDI